MLHSSLVQWNRSAETGEMELVGDLARDFSHKGTVWTLPPARGLHVLRR
ncbi:hypothetical protein QP028_07195 [Corynebacterium suedekumii]|nr:hypothetical protein QP028_07195 [Corynebacterium suedekumii]